MTGPETEQGLSDRDFEFVRKFAYELTGINISPSRRGTLSFRIHDRMRGSGESRLDEYLRFAKSNSKEREILVSLFTINETRFFRERPHLRHLFHDILPEVSGNAGERKHIKVLSAACSTGEEAYSLAIMLDQFSKRVRPVKFSITGLDIDKKALAIASRGIYPSSAKKNIPSQLLKEYFEEGVGLAKGYLRVSREIKEKVVFKQGNLLSATFATDEYDVIFCKNVFIYFDQKTIQKILSSFCEMLLPNGALYLGMSEAVHRVATNLTRQEGSIFRKAGVQQAPKQLSSVSLKKSVLIIDDSKTMQQVLAQTIKNTGKFEVGGIASGVEEAEKLLSLKKFDAVTLDLEMPVLDGLEFLHRRSGKQTPPAIIISSLSASQSTKVLDALEAGAFDYLRKPSHSDQKGFAVELERKLIACVENHVKATALSKTKSSQVVLPARFGPETSKVSCIAIGASTGGTEAIRRMLPHLPTGLPPIFIAQHIPPVFSRAFAERLNRECKIEVVEAVSGLKIEWGKAYVAPGGKHMTVVKSRQDAVIKLQDVREDLHFTPSVDLLFESVAKLFPHSVCGVLLTGMGKDGAKGLLSIKQSGGLTFAQDESTSVVYGMPKEAVLLNAADRVLPIDAMAEEVLNSIIQYRGKNERFRKSA